MNVIIWVADSLRPDHLGIYGYSRNTSAHLDELARDSVTFENAYAQATWTRPSSGTLFTGVYPSVHGANTFAHGLRPEVATLPAILKTNGMSTAVFSAMGHLSAAAGFANGVDHFEQLWEKEPYLSGTRSAQFIRSSEVRLTAQEWIAEQVRNQKPFFSVIWTIDTHVPFEKEEVWKMLPDTELEDGDFSVDSIEGIWAANKKKHLKSLLEAYDSAIMATDAEIGQLVTFLKDQKEYDKTMLIVLGDHGEVFNEHSRAETWPLFGALRLAGRLPGLGNFIRRYRLTNTWGWLGHLNILPYEEALRVPLLIKFPGEKWKASRVSHLVHIIDLPLTILEVLGFKELSGQMQGNNMLVLLEGEDVASSDYSFSDSRTHLDRYRYISVQSGKWKLIRCLGPNTDQSFSLWGALSRIESWQSILSIEEILFDVTDESMNHKRSQPVIYEHLRIVLDMWLLDNENRSSQNSLIVDNTSIREHLRNLGYVE